MSPADVAKALADKADKSDLIKALRNMASKGDVKQVTDNGWVFAFLLSDCSSNACWVGRLFLRIMVWVNRMI